MLTWRRIRRHRIQTGEGSICGAAIIRCLTPSTEEDMADELPIGKTVLIRDCGLDEVWLQNQIATNPSCLRLGELELLARERIQSSGGRLDILLKYPEDDSMYEVEVMLGDTDETHIVRTIEYWIREKRKWPRRQHFPVLVAEGMTRRFFDVIQVLSHAIPIIAIQASVVEVNGHRALTFQKILDAYEEPEDTDVVEYEAHDEAFWLEKASWTNDTAKTLLNVVKATIGGVELKYLKNYISIAINRNTYFWFHKRASPKSLLSVWVGERLIGSAKSLLDTKGIAHTVRKDHTLRITTDKKLIEENADVYRQLSEIVLQAFAD